MKCNNSNKVICNRFWTFGISSFLCCQILIMITTLDSRDLFYIYTHTVLMVIICWYWCPQLHKNKIKSTVLLELWRIYIYIVPVVENGPTSSSTSFLHGFPPLFNHALLLPILFFMVLEMLFERSFLFPNVGRVDLVEHGEYEPPAFAYLGKLLQAPPWRRVVFGDDDDGSRGFLDRLEKTRSDLFPSV